MPRFTVTRNGHTLGQIDAFGERIDLGSGSDCQVVIDDSAIATNQARFVRSSTTQKYRIEPVSPEPAITVNGINLSAPIEVSDGAVFGVVEYRIKVDYLAGEVAPSVLPTTESTEEFLDDLKSDPESVWPVESPVRDGPILEAKIHSAHPVNRIVPLVDPPRSREIPTWGWILAGAGIVLIVGILLLIAL